MENMFGFPALILNGVTKFPKYLFLGFSPAAPRPLDPYCSVVDALARTHSEVDCFGLEKVVPEGTSTSKIHQDSGFVKYFKILIVSQAFV